MKSNVLGPLVFVNISQLIYEG